MCCMPSRIQSPSAEASGWGSRICGGRRRIQDVIAVPSEKEPLVRLREGSIAWLAMQVPMHRYPFWQLEA